MQRFNKFVICFIFTIVQLNTRVGCQRKDSNTTIKGDDVLGDPSSAIDDDGTASTIDEIITPSDKCKQIVSRFASAISNFTLCSVTNSRPIHLCQWCIPNYLQVVKTHNDFIITIDEKGNPCREYFTNLDRIEIVTEAYKYVDRLWFKGKCDYCFQKDDNGTIIPEVTDDVDKFQLYYEDTKSCFNANINSSQTCQNCSFEYETLNAFYIDLGIKYGENVCLDLVDTMNTTREIWSEKFNCVPERTAEFWLHVGMGIVALTPFIFYFLAYVLSTKQEAPVLQQRRLAEAIAGTSHSADMSFHSSRLERSTTPTPSVTSRKSGLRVNKSATDLSDQYLKVPL